jgi:hypothetical protein
MNITAELFKFYVGHEHEDDDLERCNCPRAGQVGHSMCGWNHKENLPVYMAGRGDEIKKHEAMHKAVLSIRAREELK